MPRTSADTERELREKFRHFGAAYVAPNARACYEDGRLDDVAWKELARLGMWRIPVPASMGGDGLTWREFAVALEGLASSTRDLGFLLSLVAHAGVVRAVVNLGTDEQRERFLPVLLSGGVASTALTEATGGSDVARIRCHARRDGERYVMSGEKQHITNAPVADVALVLARIPELAPHDITIFLVESSLRGVARGEPEHMFGNRTSPTGPLVFEEVELGPEHVLGEPGGGLQSIYNIICLDRVLYGVIAAGFIEPMLNDALRYAHERHAFKTAIANHEYVQGRLTELRVTMDTVRAISFTGIEQLLDDDPRASATCSIAKLVGCEGLCQATQHAMNIFGHVGYMHGPIAIAVGDALGTRIAGGTAEMQRKNIFNQMVREWRQTKPEESAWTASVQA
ncbi:MAG TPA: acyl-CoA dehydrogenase family protein [Actinomycetota bacterium]|nr:acyl-CoA dehydrogenase family protein [Actinomycetota bacterium]